jgi:hypothetical protein
MLISCSSFFISNDHYFYGGSLLGGFLRTLEGKFGPWKWASDIVHCTASESSVDCKTVSPSNAHPSANGVLLVDNGKTLLVNDVVEATTTVYSVDPVSKELTLKQKVVRGILLETSGVFRLTDLQNGRILVLGQTICLKFRARATLWCAVRPPPAVIPRP